MVDVEQSARSAVEHVPLADLAQPEGLEDARLTDYFDMAFATLPHKLLQPERFEQEAIELRGRFTDPKDPDYVFKPIYHKRIPADGVAPYMASVWVRRSI